MRWPVTLTHKSVDQGMRSPLRIGEKLADRCIISCPTLQLDGNWCARSSGINVLPTILTYE